MARTKEIFTFKLNSTNNVFVRNGKIALLVQNPDDAERQIFVEINCDVVSLAENMQEKYEAAREAIENSKKTAKINSLIAIVRGDFSVDMQNYALMELESLGVDVDSVV